MQIGIFNWNAFTDWGMQVGIYNDTGLIQCGIFNKDGKVQFGLLNYNSKSYIPWLPFVNWDMGREVENDSSK